MSVPPTAPERHCPNCGQAITPSTLLCPFCGVSVVDGVWPPALAQSGTGVTDAGRPLTAGVLTSNVAAALLIGLNDWLVSRTSEAGATLVASDFLLVPLVMGIVCAFFWRRLALTTSQYFLFSLLSSAVALDVSAIFMGEGSICLLIVSPLVILLTFGGTLLGRALFSRNNATLNLSLVPLVLLVMVGDSLSKHDYHAAVSDQVLIHARPAVVWPQIAAFPAIGERPTDGLSRLGLPYPVAATVSRRSVGAERRCVFSGNLVFDERITEYVPEKRLTFDIVHQPDHPEILGHAAVRRGRFVLRDNGDGTTTLTGTSWYELYVYPSWYYDLWARGIARHVHRRVMNHIKAVCEAPGRRV